MRLDTFFSLNEICRVYRFALLLVSMALTGCGTIAGTHQLVSVDSKPRGLDLHYQRGDSHEFQGSTPTYIRLNRGLRQNFTLAPANGGAATSKQVTCRLRWAESIFPNALFSLFNVPGLLVSSTGLAIDLVTGAAFDCDDRILLTDSRAELSDVAQETICPKVLVMPVGHHDLVVSDDLRKRWRHHLRQISGFHCAVFPDELEVSRALARFNLDHTRSLSIDNLRSDQLLRLGFAAWADYLVFLQLEPQETAMADGRKRTIYRLEPEIFDAHSLEQLQLSEDFVYEITETSRVAALERPSATSWLIRQMPNAITWGADYDAFGTHRAFLSDQRDHNSVPRIISYFGVSAVEHPAGYASWDYLWSMYPTLSFFYHDRTYTYGHAISQDGSFGILSAKPRLRLTYFYVLPAISLGPTFHTPFGAFGMHLSIGTAIVSVTRSDVEEPSADVVLAPGLRFFWYGFLSDRVFTFLETRNTGFHRDPVRSPSYSLRYGYISSVGLGVFLPEVRPWARRQFSSRFGF